ncbi:hypothetical protein N2152v2_005606 [Parachlorella kessleri]
MAVPSAASCERPHFFSHATSSTRPIAKRCRVICGSNRRELLATSLIGLGTSFEAPGAGAVVPGNVQAGGPLPAVPRTQGDQASNRTSGSAALQDFQPFVKAGITTFDTADIYGPSEELIGKYLASVWDRKDIHTQVLTKLCCFGDTMRRAAIFQEVEKSVDGSRLRLGVNSIDLLQLYWDDYNNKNYSVARGAIKHVGVTNFDVPRLQEILNTGAKVISNQVQYSLIDRRPEVAMTDFCQQHGIKLLSYGTVAGGFLSDKYLGVQQREVRLDTSSKAKYAAVLGQAGGWDWLQELLQVLAGIAAKHRVSIADVATKWVLDRTMVAGVIVGARNANHVADHQQMCALQLDEEDLETIQVALDNGVQPTSDCYTWERGGIW